MFLAVFLATSTLTPDLSRRSSRCISVPTATCGGTYIAQRGEIHSPGFPGSNYPDASSCEWYLVGPTGHYLTVLFGNFTLQSTPGCSADYVEIREYNASGKNTTVNKEDIT